jgi:hypothetical protein
VDASHLTPQQAAAVVRSVAPALAYLRRLTERMDSAGWNPGDPAYSAAWRARKGLEEVTAALTKPDRPFNPPPRPWEPGGGGRAG